MAAVRCTCARQRGVESDAQAVEPERQEEIPGFLSPGFANLVCDASLRLALQSGVALSTSSFYRN